MTKLYENCQRMMCIAYANEMADACIAIGIDPFEVSRAAATKPFGYLPFMPSAGVGGDCIPVNPSYLFSTSDFPLLKHATEKMKARPARLADRLMQQLTECEKERPGPKNRKKILVVGVAFKRGQELITNSPGVGIINHLLETSHVHVSFVDPLVKEEALPYVPKLDEKSEWNKKCLEEFDSIVVVIKQVGLDFDLLKNLDRVLVQQYCQ
jgi:nucleotide sugar dehydrogenase